MAIVDTLRNVLQGEPLRVISYGAVAVVWIVTHAAYASGITTTQPPDFDAVLLAVTAGIASLTELVRRYVYSPITVERVIDAAYQAGAQGQSAPTPAEAAKPCC